MRSWALLFALLPGCIFLLHPLRDPCGDGFIQEPEECDDGNTDNNDNCSSDCKLNGTPATCGNNIIEAPEECDDGNPINTDECTASCKLAVCGDGIIESGVETCEPPNVNGCDVNCRLACDDNTDCIENPDNLCTTNERCDTTNHVCLTDPVSSDDNNACTTDSCDPALGPLHDPVNIDDNDDCTTDSCNPFSGPAHVSAPDFTLCDTDQDPNTRDICKQGICLASLCGDGFNDTGAGEECDDANSTDTDDCTNGCKTAFCGDGIIRFTVEGCDSQNLGGLSCTSFGFSGGVLSCDGNCNFDQSACTTCGNGVIQPGEACDDDNALPTDLCSASCQEEVGRTPEIEPNDSTTDATGTGLSFSSDAIAKGTVGGVPDPSDTYTFTIANPGTQVTVRTFGDEGIGTCDVNTVLTLFNSAGFPIDSNDDGPKPPCSAITATAFVINDRFFVGVGIIGNPGDYLLVIDYP